MDKLNKLTLPAVILISSLILGGFYYAYKDMWGKGFFYTMIILLLGWTIVAPIIVWVLMGRKFNREYYEFLLERGYEEV